MEIKELRRRYYEVARINFLCIKERVILKGYKMPALDMQESTTLKDIDGLIDIIQKERESSKAEIDQLKADRLEMAEALILQAGQQVNCPECGAWSGYNTPITHKDCTVLKAQQIIKGIK